MTMTLEKFVGTKLEVKEHQAACQLSIVDDNEGKRKPTKFFPITYICKKQNNKGKNNNDDVNNNRYNILSNDVEI